MIDALILLSFILFAATLTFNAFLAVAVYQIWNRVGELEDVIK